MATPSFTLHGARQLPCEPSVETHQMEFLIDRWNLAAELIGGSQVSAVVLGSAARCLSLVAQAWR
jgi:hypothetical protein